MTVTERPRAVLVGVQLPDVSDQQHAAALDELRRLCTTLGLEVVGSVRQKRTRLRAGTVLGLGKLKELASWTGGSGVVEPNVPGQRRARGGEEEPLDLGELELEEAPAPGEGDEEGAVLVPDHRATVVVVDHELSPRLQRNLERATGAEVMDRSHVIVEIFHRHARTREARLQVEIARLSYVAPRLREAGAGADRQRGGIGGKGAGESGLELDRRRIRDRIAELNKELSRIEQEDAHRRAGRRDERRVALVGYTNAGKSSLMRALTTSGVYVADKLFATLDTTVRALCPEPDARILVSDTVGFIQKLPHQLVASFRSTLEEAREASLLLYLADASDPTFREQLDVTRSTLAEIGAGEVPSRLILNKRDRLSADEQRALASTFGDAMLVSAHDPADVARVRELIITFFDGEPVEGELFVPYVQQALVRHVHERTRVLVTRHDEQGTHFSVRAPKGTLDRLRQQLAG